MTGKTYTYVRKCTLERLKYSFQIGTYKAYELENFLINNSHKIITLINWKGETWAVNIMNNPIELNIAARWQNTGERHDVTLEFEGIKLNI